MNGVRGSAFVEPEWIVLHPSDWQDIRLATDSAGQYFGGGPFLGAYGGPQGPVGASGQVSGALDSIWGKSVYVTSAIGNAGTALVGARAAGQVWSRGGVSVEATNSHSTYFTANLTAIRAERRLGLTLYRPQAMCEVRLA
jgi:HK97 family phage major capsid protein